MVLVNRRQPFNDSHICQVPNLPGIYVIFDLAGAVYTGRSGSSIRRRLQAHLRQSGNRIIAEAIRLGAGSSLSFTYYCTLKSVQQDAEVYFMHELGTIQYANLRRESLPEDR